MEVLQEWHGEFERGLKWGRQWIVMKIRRKTKKVQKLTHFVQNTRFSRLNQIACKSPGPTTRTLERKLLKNFLSVFRDWKFHSWKSHELSRKNLCVPLTTGPSTHKQVTNLSREKHEIPNFWKIFLSLFCD